eukprot:jgi/Orpsp1_1/1191308/evm.model.d7180000084820.1
MKHSQVIITDSVFDDNYYTDSFIIIDTNDELYRGNFTISDSSFLTIMGKNGPVLNIKEIDSIVVKSLIVFQKKYEPYFSNIEELRGTEGAFITNPTKFVLTPDSDDSISLLSGDLVSPNIQLCSINEYIDYLYSENILMFFVMEIDDSNNAKVADEVISYCINNTCTVPPLR